MGLVLVACRARVRVVRVMFLLLAWSETVFIGGVFAPSLSFFKERLSTFVLEELSSLFSLIACL